MFFQHIGSNIGFSCNVSYEAISEMLSLDSLYVKALLWIKNMPPAKVVVELYSFL